MVRARNFGAGPRVDLGKSGVTRRGDPVTHLTRLPHGGRQRRRAFAFARSDQSIN
jgi:hypothetical protein